MSASVPRMVIVAEPLSPATMVSPEVLASVSVPLLTDSITCTIGAALALGSLMEIALPPAEEKVKGVPTGVAWAGGKLLTRAARGAAIVTTAVRMGLLL